MYVQKKDAFVLCCISIVFKCAFKVKTACINMSLKFLHESECGHDYLYDMIIVYYYYYLLQGVRIKYIKKCDTPTSVFIRAIKLSTYESIYYN